MTRQEALARLRAQIEQGRPIIGAGAGTGLSAKCAEAEQRRCAAWAPKYG